ncbi:MAG TPA: hypothetical protein VNR89_17560 [Roseomonas sp.]|nr:hypothetical protein [Roseomonas sp.]
MPAALDKLKARMVAVWHAAIGTASPDESSARQDVIAVGWHLGRQSCQPRIDRLVSEIAKRDITIFRLQEALQEAGNAGPEHAVTYLERAIWMLESAQDDADSVMADIAARAALRSIRRALSALAPSHPDGGPALRENAAQFRDRIRTRRQELEAPHDEEGDDDCCHDD